MARTKQNAQKHKMARTSTGGKTPAKKIKKPTKADTRAVEPAKPKRRNKPGTVALREIRKLQRSSELVVPKAPMCRFVRELMDAREKDGKAMDCTGVNRITAGALEALRHAAEAYLIGLFENAQLAAIHGKRITIMPKDIKLVRRFTEKQKE